MLSPRRSFMRLFALAAGSSVTTIRRPISAETRQAATPAPPVAPSAPSTAHVAALPAPATAVETVTGIGGFFFRSHDPKSLAKWYLQHLGIALAPTSFDQKPWHQQGGATLFTPFPQDTDYFDSSKGWMINFRVRDLEKMAAQLQAAGIAVKVDPKVYNNNRFAHLQDPEGHPIELWQPGQEG